ncbi:MAG: C39 family peptidase [Clostridia bacterium]|nr:C39 family peptidase [Clostridia bacterium]
MKKIIYYLGISVILIFMLAFAVNASDISSEGKVLFYDIEDTWYTQGLEFSYINGYINGTGKYQFSPEKPLTRESAVCILARISGDDLSDYNNNHFSDTLNGEWYSKELSWAYEKGYIKGVGNGKFGLGKSITREEFAVILYNYALKNNLIDDFNGNIEKYLDKAEISDWAREGIGFCVFNELMQGTKENVFSPKEVFNRAQAVKVARSLVLNVCVKKCDHELSEPSCTEASSCTRCGIKFKLPLGHYCKGLNCLSGGECERCKLNIEADPDAHDFLNATCQRPAMCKNCKASFGGISGHKYSAATCLAPEKCIYCYTTKGKSLGHTTNDGICSRCNTEIHTKKVLSVPYIYQGYDYPNGCEAVSTVMAMRYYGIDISVDYFIDELLPRGSAPVVGGIGPDPDKVYCGNPRSMGGWGCYSPVIANVLEGYLDPQYFTYSHSYSKSLQNLCDEYINNGIPVIVWGTLYMQNASGAGNYAYWTTPEGKGIAYNKRLHCLVLVGYDENNYYFNDPWEGKAVTYSKARAQKAFELLGSQSIAIIKKG